MRLFNWITKKQSEPVCACKAGAVEMEAEKINSECCSEAGSKICSIKVLGPGCKSCHQLYENVQKALVARGIEVEVEYITDMEKVVSYGVMSTPALVVNEKVAASGKVLSEEAVVKLLHRLGY